MIEGNAVCLACGDTVTGVVFRTSRSQCYVFHGGPSDSRNGIKFHTREAVRVERDAVNLVIPMGGQAKWEADGWQVPRREGTDN